MVRPGRIEEYMVITDCLSKQGLGGQVGMSLSEEMIGTHVIRTGHSLFY